MSCGGRLLNGHETMLKKIWIQYYTVYNIITIYIIPAEVISTIWLELLTWLSDITQILRFGHWNGWCVCGSVIYRIIRKIGFLFFVLFYYYCSCVSVCMNVWQMCVNMWWRSILAYLNVLGMVMKIDRPKTFGIIFRVLLLITQYRYISY